MPREREKKALEEDLEEFEDPLDEDLTEGPLEEAPVPETDFPAEAGAQGSAKKGLYGKVEDAYYGLLDWLEEKGIGFPWKYNDFLEGHGIPSLPFTLALIVIVIAGIYGLFFLSSAVDASVLLHIRDDGARSLSGVIVNAFDAEGNRIGIQQELADNEALELKGVSIGQQIRITAEKEGYETAEHIVTINAKEIETVIELQRVFSGIVGRIKLIDNETSTTIKSATITGDWPGAAHPVTGVLDETTGILSLTGLPKGSPVTVRIRADNYEDTDQTITFVSEDVKIIQLTPTSIALQGTSDVLVHVSDAQSLEKIEGARVKILDQRNGNELVSQVAVNGELVAKLSKGSVIRVTVEKEGYELFDSLSNGEGITLRDDEHVINADLQKGGTKLLVGVSSQKTGAVIEGAQVEWRDSQGQLLGSKVSGLDGSVSFDGLELDTQYFGTAYAENYLPQRVSFRAQDLEQGSEDQRILAIQLEAVTQGNSSALTVFVTEKGAPANNATLSFFETVNGQKLPLGIPDAKTDAIGTFVGTFELGMHISVHAQKESLSGEGDIQIQSGLNKLEIPLQADDKIVELTVLGEDGKPFTGHVLIESPSGTVLFDGDIADGKVFFDPQGNSMVKVKLINPNGKEFSTNAFVEGKDKIQVQFGGQSVSGLAPAIKYAGVFNASGTAVEGLSPEQDYVLRFEVAWPQGPYNGGIHIRIGNDEIKFVDAQNVGIIGQASSANAFFYGRTWNGQPAPGNEAMDKKNAGEPGKFNKWVELYFKNPSGTQQVDIRVKARQTVQQGVVPVFYRAWSEIQNQFNRVPLDAVLGTSSYTSQKMGLYAQALEAQVKTFKSQPFCAEGVCVEFKFVDDTGRAFEPSAFNAVLGKVYALQVDLQSLESDAQSTPLKVNTSKAQPLVLFYGKVEGSEFGAFPSAEPVETEVTGNIPILEAGGRARVHFKAIGEGSAFVNVQLTTPSKSVSKKFNFNVSKEKQLTAKFSLDNIQTGQDFSVVVHEGEDEFGMPLSNALVQIKDEKGKVHASIAGINAKNRGLNGIYAFKNNLAPGTYLLHVTAPGYAPFETTFGIGEKGALTIVEQSITISIFSGQTTGTARFTVRNNSSVPLQNLTAQVDLLGNFPTTLSLDAKGVPTLGPKSQAQFTLTSTYSGQAGDKAYGEAKVTVTGETASKWNASASTLAHVYYNKPLDESCLEFNKNELSVTLTGDPYSYNFSNSYAYDRYTTPYNYDYLSGTTNSLYSNALYNNSLSNNSLYNSNLVYPSGSLYNNTSKKTTFIATNKCDVELQLNPRVLATETYDGVEVRAHNVTLKPGQQQSVEVTVANSLYRSGLPQNGLLYSIAFESPTIVKSIPLRVNVWNPFFAVAAPDEIEVYVSGDGSQNKKEEAFIPVTNIGMAPIFDLRLEKSQKNLNGVSIKLPSTGTQLLPQGAQLIPPFLVEVQATGKESSTQTETLTISGVIDGRKHSLKQVNLVIHASAQSCLTIIPETDPLVFQGTELDGAIGKKFSVLNKCAEPVRISSVEPNAVGGNPLQFQFIGYQGSATTIPDLPGNSNAPPPDNTPSAPAAPGFPDSKPSTIEEIKNQQGQAATSALKQSVAQFQEIALIQPNQRAEFQLIMEKKTNYKGKLSAKVNALLVNTQKFVSQSFPLEIAFGPLEATSGRASAPLNVEVCDQPGKYIPVKLPQLASASVCNNAYCDSVQLSEYLARELENKVKEVQSKVSLKKSDASNFPGCDAGKGYCKFSSVGVKTEPFTVYLQNDRLSPEVMRNALNPSTSTSAPTRLSTYDVSYLGAPFENQDDAFVQRLGTGYGNKIFIPDTIQGCGAYVVSIDGAVEIAGGQLITDQLNLLVRLEQQFPTMNAECQAENIENAYNFLPQDKGLTPLNHLYTLPGTITPGGAGLEAEGKALSRELFGTEERYTLDKQFNRVSIELDDTLKTLARLEFDITTSNSLDKAFILRMQKPKSNSPELQQRISSEVGRALKNLSATLAKNACMASNHSYIEIKSAPDATLSQVELKGCNERTTLPGAPGIPSTSVGQLTVRSTDSSCAMTVSAGVPGSANIVLDKTPADIQGLNALELRETDARGIVASKVMGSVNQYELQFNPKTKKYEKNFFVLARADAAMLGNVHGQLVNVKADVSGISRSMDIELKACTVTPEELIERTYAKGNGEFYGTVSWEGPGSARDLKQVLDNLRAQGKFQNIYFTAPSLGVDHQPDKVFQERNRSHKLKAVLKDYMAACLATCVACYSTGAIISLGAGAGFSMAGALSCSWDCGIPSGIAAYEIERDYLQQVTPFVTTAVDYSVGLPATGARASGLLEGEDPEAKAALATALGTQTVQGIVQGRNAGAAVAEVTGKTQDIKNIGSFTGATAGSLQSVKVLAEQHTTSNNALTTVNGHIANYQTAEAALTSAAKDVAKAVNKVNAIETQLLSKIPGTPAHNALTNALGLATNDLTAKEAIENTAKTALNTAKSTTLTSAQANGLGNFVKVEDVLPAIATNNAENAKLATAVREGAEKNLAEIDDFIAELKKARADKLIDPRDVHDIINAAENTLKPQLNTVVTAARAGNMANVSTGIQTIQTTTVIIKGTSQPLSALDNSLKIATKDSKLGFWSRDGRLAKWSKFWKGLICGSAGNLAGYAQYTTNVKKVVDDKAEFTTLDTSTSTFGRFDGKFVKGRTYKIQVIRSTTNPTNYDLQISEVLDLGTANITEDQRVDQCTDK